MKKIITIVGARPQFVKAAVLSRLIRSEKWSNQFREILLHTGQHYDENMSEVFFRDMQIPQPELQLKIGGLGHGAMTGQMLIEIEVALLKEKPDIVLVYGDTNSTLAGALAASKLHIPVVHVEAGLRSYNMRMPEEQNRILTDHLSQWLFCSTDTSVTNLQKEGITKGVYQSGDIMYDATLFYLKVIELEKKKGINRLLSIGLKKLPDSFLLATLHRAENTDDLHRLSSITEAFNALNTDIVLPLHPRTRKKISEAGLKLESHIHIIEPVGYLEMLELESLASAIITDSGGIQKEAYFMHKPCITMRDETEWVETVESGWNTLVGADKGKIIEAVLAASTPSIHPAFYGEGDAGQKILKILSEI